jgi:hypothetical protein
MYNIKTDFREIVYEGMDWTQSLQHKLQRWSLINTIITFLEFQDGELAGINERKLFY